MSSGNGMKERLSYLYWLYPKSPSSLCTLPHFSYLLARFVHDGGTHLARVIVRAREFMVAPDGPNPHAHLAISRLINWQ
jgi:hypothetical protein